MASLNVLICSIAQVFIVCAFGQKFHDEVALLRIQKIGFNCVIYIHFQTLNFSDALYNTDWLNMDTGTRKILLLLLTGSQRKVNIQAGGIFELNLALFAQVRVMSLNF